MKHQKYGTQDKASQLLADILDDTEDAADEQQADLERALESQRKAKLRAVAEEKALRVAEQQRKLEVEMERQRELARKRTQKMHALSAVEPIPAPSSTPSPTGDDDERIRREAEISTELMRSQIEAQIRRELHEITAAPLPPVRGGAGPGVRGLILQPTIHPERLAYMKPPICPCRRCPICPRSTTLRAATRGGWPC